MFKYYSSYALVFSNFTHLLCCGLPTIIGLSSLLTNFMFIEVFISNIEAFEAFEIYLFVISSSILLMLVLQEIYNRKIKCSDDIDCCEAKECESTKKKIKINIIFSLVLYIFNSTLFLYEIIT
jgi:hypothetical protein